MIVGIVIAVIVILLIVWGVSRYNKLVRGRNNVKEGFSTMDVYLKKRHDLIPNLVETVKGYAAHEKETLERVIAARNAAVAAPTMGEQIKDENKLSGALRQLFALSENYPDLKANTNFQDLMAQLKQVEEDIANSRKYYNGTVREYNNSCEMFPGSVIAGLFHFQTEQMYEVTDETDRENVEVKF